MNLKSIKQTPNFLSKSNPDSAKLLDKAVKEASKPEFNNFNTYPNGTIREKVIKGDRPRYSTFFIRLLNGDYWELNFNTYPHRALRRYINREEDTKIGRFDPFPADMTDRVLFSKFDDDILTFIYHTLEQKYIKQIRDTKFIFNDDRPICSWSWYYTDRAYNILQCENVSDTEYLDKNGNLIYRCKQHIGLSNHSYSSRTVNKI